MAGYSKLFQLVIASAIWPEPENVLRTWLALRALTDKKGFIEAKLEGLANIAKVSATNCKLALIRLTELNQVNPVENGFQLFNYKRDYEIIQNEERKDYLAKKQGEHRQRIKDNQLSDEVRLSELLLSLIRSRKPDFKQPNIEKWAKCISLMLRVDDPPRTPERIEAVIHWCQADNFWQNNILSPEKLRKHFDQLEMKMKPAGETIAEQAKRLKEAGEL